MKMLTGLWMPLVLRLEPKMLKLSVPKALIPSSLPSWHRPHHLHSMAV